MDGHSKYFRWAKAHFALILTHPVQYTKSQTQKKCQELCLGRFELHESWYAAVQCSRKLMHKQKLLILFYICLQLVPNK